MNSCLWLKAKLRQVFTETLSSGYLKLVTQIWALGSLTPLKKIPLE